jgi:hypothetical protein
LTVSGLNLENGFAAALNGSGEQLRACFGRCFGRRAYDTVFADRLEWAPDGNRRACVKVRIWP